MKPWPTTCFRLLGGHVKNEWTNSTQTSSGQSVHNIVTAVMLITLKNGKSGGCFPLPMSLSIA